MRRLVVLQGVVGHVLPAFGEHHTVDLRLGAATDERHMLIHLGQPRSERARWSIADCRRDRPGLFDGQSAKHRVPSFAS